MKAVTGGVDETFAKGRIYRSSATGARWARGGIGGAYQLFHHGMIL